MSAGNDPAGQRESAMIHPNSAMAIAELHRREMLAQARVARLGRAVRDINRDRSGRGWALSARRVTRQRSEMQRVSASSALPSGSAR